MDHAARKGPSWRFWAIAGLSLLWNAFGCFDFVMTNARDPRYLAQFPSEMINFLDGFPTWATAAWGLGVGGALAGSLLLLLRSLYAVHAFALSLAGLAASTIYQGTVEVPAAMRTPAMLAMNVIIWAAAIVFLWYAWTRRKAGVLY